MVPGTLFFDENFKFHDGEEGRKIFVVLGTNSQIVLVVKTTSQGHRYLNDFGCQITHRFPNFHLVQGCCCLSKRTWVNLDEFYEFKNTDLLAKHFTGTVKRLGVLPSELAISLLECATKSEDISISQLKITRSTLEEIRRLAAES